MMCNDMYIYIYIFIFLFIYLDICGWVDFGVVDPNSSRPLCQVCLLMFVVYSCLIMFTL